MHIRIFQIKRLSLILFDLPPTQLSCQQTRSAVKNVCLLCISSILHYLKNLTTWIVFHPTAPFLIGGMLLAFCYSIDIFMVDVHTFTASTHHAAYRESMHPNSHHYPLVRRKLQRQLLNLNLFKPRVAHYLSYISS